MHAMVTERLEGKTLRSRFFRMALLGMTVMSLVLVLNGVGVVSANVIGNQGASALGAEVQAKDLLAQIAQQDAGIRDYAIDGNAPALRLFLQARAATGPIVTALSHGPAGTSRSSQLARVESAADGWQAWADGVRRQVSMTGPIHGGSRLQEGARLFAVLKTELGKLTAGLNTDSQRWVTIATVTGIVPTVAV